MSVYLDTSALAKWYLNENRSEDFEAFMSHQHQECWISTLTKVEIRCLFARRRRNGDYDDELESILFSAFERDIKIGALKMVSLTETITDEAVALISDLAGFSLRSLDAIHLACARELGLQALATADKIMAEVGETLSFRILRFD